MYPHVAFHTNLTGRPELRISAGLAYLIGMNGIIQRFDKVTLIFFDKVTLN